jgi:hypothetical protein
MSQCLILIDVLFSACWEKKKRKKRNDQGPFYPGPEAGHTLLAMLRGIFAAIRIN